MLNMAFEMKGLLFFNGKHNVSMAQSGAFLTCKPRVPGLIPVEAQNHFVDCCK